MEDVCKVFEYMLQLSSTVAIAGRALAHSPSTRKGALPPKMLSDSSPELKDFFDQFVNILLVSRVPERFLTSSLRILLDVVAAELIMHHRTMKSELGSSDPVVALITNTVKQLKLPASKFLKLGLDIESDWHSRNGIKKSNLNSSHTTALSSDQDVHVASICEELGSKIEDKLEVAIDLIVDKVVEKLAAVLKIQTPNTSTTSDNNRISIPDIQSSGAEQSTLIATVGDRGTYIHQITTLSKLGLAVMIETYFCHYMDKYSDATWQVAVPNKGNRSRILTVIRYVMANILSSHSAVISNRPSENSLSISPEEFIAWKKAMTKLSQQMEEHIILSINSDTSVQIPHTFQVYNIRRR